MLKQLHHTPAGRFIYFGLV